VSILHLPIGQYQALHQLSETISDAIRLGVIVVSVPIAALVLAEGLRTLARALAAVRQRRRTRLLHAPPAGGGRGR
jgi:hypothetical protein